MDYILLKKEICSIKKKICQVCFNAYLKLIFSFNFLHSFDKCNLGLETNNLKTAFKRFLIKTFMNFLIINFLYSL